MTLTYVVPTTPSRPFKRGDIVDVMDREGVRISTRRIVYANKSVRTNCGRRWSLRGWYVGNSEWPFPWIRHSRKKRFESDGDA